tara:strand:+ start:654 stop:1232 length:579 start_codon:yes stop_codon:yes gene_type:complete
MDFLNLMLIEMVSLFSFLKKSLTRLLVSLALMFGFLLNPISAFALYPSDPSSVDVLKGDLHGKDLQNTEYVKYDLSSQDLGEANLQGAYMSVTTAKNASFTGANMKDLIAYAVRFDNADLSNADLTNGELMKSVFDGANIDGTDFTNANLDLAQRKSLCSRATGTNSKTGVDTFDSLECSGLKGYTPPKPKA